VIESSHRVPGDDCCEVRCAAEVCRVGCDGINQSSGCGVVLVLLSPRAESSTGQMGQSDTPQSQANESEWGA
jgi:hypothetical protein